MERQEEGRIGTDDIASGGGEGRLPEREPGSDRREGDPPAEHGGQAQGPPAQGAPAQREPAQGEPAQGAPAQGGEYASGEAAGVPPAGGGGGFQPQSPADPQGQRGGEHSVAAAEGAGAPADQGGAATAERTEGGGAPGAVPGGAGDGQTAGGPSSQSGAGGAGSGGATALLADNDAREFERRWQDVQVGFVDEPQRCVQEADGLVAEVMQRLADGFARERKDLEAQWAGGGEASTEDLRVALQRYRSFFERLLKTS